MNFLHRTLLFATLATTLGSAGKASAQEVRSNWTGPIGVEADWDEGDLGQGEGINWQATLQPDGAYGEYASVSNGGIALIDHPIALSPGDIRIGQDAATTGTLAIRNGGSITVQTGTAGTGTLANGVSGAGTLVLRDNMGAVSVQRYTQNAASTLVVQLSGTSTFANRVTASTSISIDGTLRVDRAPGSTFTAAAGNSWTIISGAPVSGSFDAVVVDPKLRGNAGQIFTVSTASNAVSMTVEQRLVAQVDRFTGSVKLVNPAGHATNIPLINYTLSSPTNGVSAAAGRWNSLADQAVSGWFEANPTATQLSELNPVGQLTLSSGQSRDLGVPINANVAAPLGTSRVSIGDVTLQYQTPSGEFLNAVVEPVGRFNDVVLVVNPTTGSATIQNQSAQTIDFISYVISSPSASLLPSYSGISGTGAPSWFKANPTTTNIAELSTIGSSNMGVGAEFALGLAWNPSGAQDLTFRYQAPDGFLRNGTVYFGDKAIVAPSNNADFDGNNIVDGADFLAWQRGFGLTAQPNKSTGDANGDGNVTAADLTIWKQQFGTNPGAAAVAAASVPEPATGALAVGALAVVALRRRQASR